MHAPPTSGSGARASRCRWEVSPAAPLAPALVPRPTARRDPRPASRAGPRPCGRAPSPGRTAVASAARRAAGWRSRACGRPGPRVPSPAAGGRVPPGRARRPRAPRPAPGAAGRPRSGVAVSSRRALGKSDVSQAREDDANGLGRAALPVMRQARLEVAERGGRVPLVQQDRPQAATAGGGLRGVAPLEEPAQGVLEDGARLAVAPREDERPAQRLLALQLHRRMADAASQGQGVLEGGERPLHVALLKLQLTAQPQGPRPLHARGGAAQDVLAVVQQQEHLAGRQLRDQRGALPHADGGGGCPQCSGGFVSRASGPRQSSNRKKGEAVTPGDVTCWRCHISGCDVRAQWPR